LGEGTRAAYELVRAHSAFVDRDRRLDGDIAELSALITSGAFAAVVD
jgi:histidine ammonia-lyase